MKNVMFKNIQKSINNSINKFSLQNISLLKQGLTINNNFNYSSFNNLYKTNSAILKNTKNIYKTKMFYFSKQLPEHNKLKLPTLSPSMETVMLIYYKF